MKNRLISFCLVLLLLVGLPLTAAAHEYDSNQRGSISVSLVSKNTAAAMEGAELSVFYVATVGYSADGTLIYSYTEHFVDCGIPMDDPDWIGKLDMFVTEHPVDCRKIVTDAQGKAICKDLPLGLYFIKQTGDAEGFARCDSFFVTIPMKTEEGYQYDVDASPKTDVIRYINLTIRKVWNTDISTQIPDSVTIQLLRGDTVVDTATLSEANDWQITYSDLSESDAYSIKELNIPKGFTATYTRDGYTFTAINTPSLIQTGQLIWPVPVLAMAGLFFLLTGVAILRKTEKHNA